MLLVVEQFLNGLQFGLMLFLLAAGLTLVFGIMDTINLAHGSLYIVGAYPTASATARSSSCPAESGRSHRRHHVDRGVARSLGAAPPLPPRPLVAGAGHLRDPADE